MPPRRLLALLVLPLLPVLVVAGCGGSGDAPRARTAPGLPGATTSTSALVTGGSAVSTPFTLGGGKGPPANTACLPVPPPGPRFDWLPPDLPLPTGSYPVADSDVAAGTVTGPYHRGLLAVRGSLLEFVRFALAEWPKSGWALGRGESEPGEAEDGFAKGNVAGAFRARAAFCDSGWTQLLLVIGQRPSTPPTSGP